MLYAVVMTVAFGITAISAPILRKRLLRSNLLDQPSHRSSHTVPVPRGGGLACIFGLTVGMIFAGASGAQVPWSATLIAVSIAVVGLIDDKYTLPALPRLGAQVLGGAALGTALEGEIWIVLGALALPLIVNVVNFVDGINGITALTMTVWGATALFVGLAGSNQPLAILGACTAAVALGFLPWNAPVARLFLGDVGSYLFGAIAAGGILLGGSQGNAVWVLAAPIAIPTADVLTTLVRRAWRGETLFEAHREHTYQQLVHNLRLSHTTTAAAIATASLLLTIVALLAPPAIAIATVAATIVFYLAAPKTFKLLLGRTGMPPEAVPLRARRDGRPPNNDFSPPCREDQ